MAAASASDSSSETAAAVHAPDEYYTVGIRAYTNQSADMAERRRAVQHEVLKSATVFRTGTNEEKEVMRKFVTEIGGQGTEHKLLAFAELNGYDFEQLMEGHRVGDGAAAGTDPRHSPAAAEASDGPGDGSEKHTIRERSAIAAGINRFRTSDHSTNRCMRAAISVSISMMYIDHAH